MKTLFPILLALVLLESCNNNDKEINESNYILIGTDSFRHTVASKAYVDKFDTSCRLLKLYSVDGILLAKGFYKGKMRNGPQEMYYISNGKLKSSENYKNGEKDGLQREYFINGKLQKTEKFINGKLVYSENYDTSRNIIK
jgi:hypothetical protein